MDLFDVELPGPLAALLNDLGFIWPEISITKLVKLAMTWAGISPELSSHASDANAHAAAVWLNNEGAAIKAFEAAFTSGRSPLTNLRNASTDTKIVAVALLCAAAIVLCLQLNTSVQLGALFAEIAEAVATAIPSLGTSLLEIPVFKEITGRIIGALVNEAVSNLMQA